jgi:hypothetical protein
MVRLLNIVQPTDITHTLYSKCRSCSISWKWARNARSLYWHTVMHGHYTDILWYTVTILTYWCTVTILSYYDARSLYFHTMMNGHYTDILWYTVTILTYCDARSLYWHTLMHGQQNINSVRYIFRSEFPPETTLWILSYKFLELSSFRPTDSGSSALIST